MDQFGQVIDVLLSEQRDTRAARRFFTRALRYGPTPVEVTTDKAGPYLRVLADLVPSAAHVTEQYGNNRIEADHARLKARLRPMRGLKQFRSTAVITRGHAFVQNLRRGHYELATDAPPLLRLATAAGVSRAFVSVIEHGGAGVNVYRLGLLHSPIATDLDRRSSGVMRPSTVRQARS